MKLMIFIGLFLLIVSIYSVLEKDDLSIFGFFGTLLSLTIILLCL